MQTLAKIQVTAIFLMQDMRRRFFPTFIETCMETPCGAHLVFFLQIVLVPRPLFRSSPLTESLEQASSNMAAGNQQKHLH